MAVKLPRLLKNQSNQAVFNPFLSIEEITTTDETKIAYVERTERLLKQAKKDLEMDETPSAQQMVMWLKEKRKHITKNSYRLYKAALVFYYSEHDATPQNVEAAIELVKLSSDLSLKKSDKTSGAKQKHIKDEDMKKILKYIEEKQDVHEYALYLKYWLKAGIATGLRPIEWCNAEIIMHENKLALKVKNAKNTNGRANGEYRILLINEMNEEDINDIRIHLKNIQNFVQLDMYERFYMSCSTELKRITKHLFKNRKKNISLYSTRHQFSANAKKTNLTTSQVAALMGHSVDDTANAYYGKKQFGNINTKIRPTKEQTDSVRKIFNNDYMEKMKQKRKKNKENIIPFDYQNNKE